MNLTINDRRKLMALRAELDKPEADRVRAKHEAAKARNARLAAYNLRRSLVARGVIRVAS